MFHGLDGIVAAETALSHVDGARGELVVRGRMLQDLAGEMSFESVAALLWQGLAVPELDGTGVAQQLARARREIWPEVAATLSAGAELTVLEGVRLGLARLSDSHPVAHHLLVSAAMPVLIAAFSRARQGAPPIAPDPGLGQAADFLRMLHGKPARDAHVAALDAYLVTVADHGLNASTFAARVIASTRAGMISAVVGALCALKGPLHGGAPGPVLDMLDAIGEADDIDRWLTARLDSGERLMGFGHRVYRVRDPRADVLKGCVAQLRGDANRIAFAEQVERAALEALARRKPDRRLDTNVEFYTALLLEALGLPRQAFTAVFAMGRVAGWSAHVLEQERDGRLIRPQSKYVGPAVRAA